MLSRRPVLRRERGPSRVRRAQGLRRDLLFNHTATTEIYTLSLHDALPISCHGSCSAPAESTYIDSTADSRQFACKIGRAHGSTPVTFTNIVRRLLLKK